MPSCSKAARHYQPSKQIWSFKDAGTLEAETGAERDQKLVELYGSRLVCVRNRYDEKSQKRFKTVELIVEESPWSPPPIKPDKLVGVRVELNEAELQRKVKLAGGKWFPQHKVWHLRYDQAVALGLEARIEHRKVSNITNLRKSKNL